MRISDWSSDVCSSDLRAFLKNPVEASINAFLLETSAGLVLIDAGAGEVFGPGYGGRLVESLAVAGVEPSQIRHVLITHVHSDNSGGLVVKGRPVFSHSDIHVGQPATSEEGRGGK